MITEVAQSKFKANEATRLLASPEGQGNIKHAAIVNRAIQELPSYLKKTGYRNPIDHLDTAFQMGYNTREQPFLHLRGDPDVLTNFYSSLKALESPVKWTAVVPLAKILQGGDTNVPLFVDIGGGHGFQAAAFRNATIKQFPTGRIINQDLPETLALAPKYENIEMMSQNFYEKQQVTGSYIKVLLIPGFLDSW